MTETDAEKAYVKLQQAQDCYHTEPWPQLKVLEHEMGGTYHHEDLDLGLASTWRFPDGSKLYVLGSSRVFVG